MVKYFSLPNLSATALETMPAPYNNPLKYPAQFEEGLDHDAFRKWRAALVRLRDAGFNVLFHVHDEVIIEVPSTFKNLDKIRSIMCLESEWMPGLPLEVEMDESKYYKK